MGKGEWQVALEPGIKGLEIDGSTVIIPDVTIALRGGITDRLDMGGRIGSNIYDLHMKYQFSDPESSGPVLSIAPALSLIAAGGGVDGGGGGGILGAINIPLLIGLPLGEHQFVIGPRVIDYFVGGGGGGEAALANFLFVGSSFAFALATGENLSLIPELTVAYPVVAGVTTSEGSGSTGLIGDGLLFEFKLGFQIGAQ